MMLLVPNTRKAHVPRCALVVPLPNLDAPTPPAKQWRPPPRHLIECETAAPQGAHALLAAKRAGNGAGKKRRKKKAATSDSEGESAGSDGEAAKGGLRQEPVAAFLDPTENELDDEVERILGHRCAGSVGRGCWAAPPACLAAYVAFAYRSRGARL